MMKLNKGPVLGCIGAVVVDLVASFTVALATRASDECAAGFYLCSFQDLVPAAGIRVAALVLTWALAVLAATERRKGSSVSRVRSLCATCEFVNDLAP